MLLSSVFSLVVSVVVLSYLVMHRFLKILNYLVSSLFVSWVTIHHVFYVGLVKRYVKRRVLHYVLVTIRAVLVYVAGMVMLIHS